MSLVEADDELVPLLGIRPVSYGQRPTATAATAPPESPEQPSRRLTGEEVLPLDCWKVVVGFLIPPLSSDALAVPYRRVACNLAHSFWALRLAVATTWNPECGLEEVIEVKSCCLAPVTSCPGGNVMVTVCSIPHSTVVVHRKDLSDHVHRTFAETILIQPIQHMASDTLKERVHDTVREATDLIIYFFQWAYLTLFFPTTFTLLGLIHPTFKLWTMLYASVLFCPLAYFGFKGCYITLRWWAAVNPHARCSHVTRSALTHALHPEPWFRVSVILITTVVVGALVAYLAWIFGAWLDGLPYDSTQWGLLALMFLCYWP